MMNYDKPNEDVVRELAQLKLEHEALRLSILVEREERNAALLASETKFANLVDDINDVIYTTDDKANITFISPSIKKLLGYTQEEITGKNFTMFIDSHADQLHSRFEEIQKTLDLQNEYQIISKTGEYHWIRFSSKAIIKEGIFKGITGILIDVSETKKIELELQKSESLYRSILNASPDTIFIADLNGNVLFVSPMAKKMFRYEDREFPLNQSLFNFLDPKDHEKAKKAIGEMFDGKFTGATDYVGIRSDGSSLEMEVNGEFIRDAEGNPTRMVFVARDISERKIAEKKLLKSEETYRKLVESINDIVFDVALDGTIKYLSPSITKLLNYNQEQLIGKNFFTFVHPDDKAFLLDVFRNNRFNEFSYIEYRCLSEEGKIIWVQVSAQYSYEDGKIVGRSGILHDITNQKLAEEKLRKSEERYSQIADQSRIAIWEIDSSGLFTYVNTMAESLWGYTKEEIIGQKYFYDLHPEEGREEFKQFAMAAIHRKEKFSDLINQIVTKDNRLIWVSTNGVPITDSQNELIGYSGADNDITERLNAEIELKQREKELNEAQKIAQMCSWELDVVNDHLSWSENYYRIMGIPMGTEMNTQFFLNRVHPDDMHLVDEKYEEMLLTHKPVQYDLRVKMPNGKYNNIQNNIVPEFNEDKLISFRGVNIDVTDKKIDEEKIKSQNERLNAIISAIPDLIFVMTKDGTYLEYFAAEPHKLLVKPESIIGLNIRQAFDEEMTNLFLNKISEAILHKKMVVVNYEINLPDSPSTHFEARIAPLDEDKVLILSRDVTEQAKNEILIKKLSLVVEQSPVITVITDIKGFIEYVNPAFEKITGYSQSEVLGQNTSVFQSGLTDRKLYEKLWKNIQNGKEWHGEWISKKKNGENYWEDVAISPILDQSGKIINYLAIKQNIEERKQTEEILKQSEESYRHMFGNNPQPMWIYDLETLAFLEVNDAAIRHYGYSRKEFLTMTLREIRPPEDIPDLLKDVEISKKIYNTANEWRHLKKNGELIYVAISSHAITFNDRQARHILVTDITERKRIEKEIRELNANLEQKIEERTLQLNNLNTNLLKEIEFRKQTEVALSKSEKSYRMVVENVNEIFFQIDTEARWSFLNKSWEEVTGFSVSESLGKPFLSFVHPEDREKNLLLFNHLINREKDYCRHEIRYLTKNGDFRWIEVFARLGLNEKNEITGTYGTLQDITERRRSNELIQKARLEAEQANMAKSEFLSRMSHELRTPMNSILGFAQLLEMGELSQKQRKSIDHILRSGRHLLQLINEVLDISRIEAGHLAIHPEPIPINKLNREIIDIVTPMASERQIKLEISSDTNDDYLVNSDSQRLKQVMLNLTSNAIKYNRIGGSVFIHSEMINSDEAGINLIRISVIDTGIGIDAPNIPNIFTPFERIGAERSGVEGTGLGLAVVSKIMKALGGNIGVESKSGEGSKFWIELPAIASDEHPIDPYVSKSKPLEANHTGLILYIEDNTSNFELVEQFLAIQRPEIHLITNIYGKMAVPMAIKYDPDLILLDLNLPDIDGNKVMELLLSEERTKSIPVVVISADAMPERFDLLLKSGAKQYLTKPLNLVDLLSVIDNYMPTEKNQL